jgi:hypothetical protein
MCAPEINQAPSPVGRDHAFAGQHRAQCLIAALKASVVR